MGSNEILSNDMNLVERNIGLVDRNIGLVDRLEWLEEKERMEEKAKHCGNLR